MKSDVLERKMVNGKEWRKWDLAWEQDMEQVDTKKWLILGERNDEMEAFQRQLMDQDDEVFLFSLTHEERVSLLLREYQPNYILFVVDQPVMSSVKVCVTFFQVLRKIAQSMISTKVYLVTKNLQVIEEQDKVIVDIMLYGLYGIARTAGYKEYASIWGGMFDMDAIGDEKSSEIIWKAIRSEKAQGLELGIRDGYVYQKQIKEDFFSENELPEMFTEEDGILITDAFNSLGKWLCQYVVERGAKKLFLITKSKQSKEQAAFVRKLTKAGVKVKVGIFDVTDEVEVESFVAKMSRTDKITSVFYTAGSMKNQLLEEMTGIEFVEVFWEKARGAWNIHAATLEEPIDNFVIFSSIASVFPRAGQANYAAGDCALNALGQYRKQNGLPTRNVNWAAWSIEMGKDVF